MSIKTKNMIALIILLIILIFSVGYIGGRLGRDRALNRLESALNDTVTYYTVKIGGKDAFIAEKDQEIATKNELIRLGEIDRKTLRAINLKQVAEINKLQFRVDTLLEDVNHGGTIITIHDTVNVKDTLQKAILLPFVFNITDEWLELKGRFDPMGKLSVGITMVADVNVYTGYDKTAKSYKSVVTSDSPYLQTIGIKSFKLDLQKPKKLGFSLQIGYGILLTNPVKSGFYTGFGFDYSFLRF